MIWVISRRRAGRAPQPCRLACVASSFRRDITRPEDTPFSAATLSISVLCSSYFKVVPRGLYYRAARFRPQRLVTYFLMTPQIFAERRFA
jgi:hypothetical protein